MGGIEIEKSNDSWEATGSIGTQTLDVISQNSDDFEVVALTASESVEKMAELIQRFCRLMPL